VIRISIKVSNDHQSLTEHFELEEILLSLDSPTVQELSKIVIDKFREPVEDVRIKATMDL
jgi:hypothetical protein